MWRKMKIYALLAVLCTFFEELKCQDMQQDCDVRFWYADVLEILHGKESELSPREASMMKKVELMMERVQYGESPYVPCSLLLTYGSILVPKQKLNIVLNTIKNTEDGAEISEEDIQATKSKREGENKEEEGEDRQNKGRETNNGGRGVETPLHELEDTGGVVIFYEDDDEEEESKDDKAHEDKEEIKTDPDKEKVEEEEKEMVIFYEDDNEEEESNDKYGIGNSKAHEDKEEIKTDPGTEKVEEEEKEMVIFYEDDNKEEERNGDSGIDNSKTQEDKEENKKDPGKKNVEEEEKETVIFYEDDNKEEERNVDSGIDNSKRHEDKEENKKDPVKKNVEEEEKKTPDRNDEDTPDVRNVPRVDEDKEEVRKTDGLKKAIEDEKEEKTEENVIDALDDNEPEEDEDTLDENTLEEEDDLDEDQDEDIDDSDENDDEIEKVDSKNDSKPSKLGEIPPGKTVVQGNDKFTRKNLYNSPTSKDIYRKLCRTINTSKAKSIQTSVHFCQYCNILLGVCDKDGTAHNETRSLLADNAPEPQVTDKKEILVDTAAEDDKYVSAEETQAHNTNPEDNAQTNSESTEESPHAPDPEDSKNMASDDTVSKTDMDVKGSKEDEKEDEHSDSPAEDDKYVPPEESQAQNTNPENSEQTSSDSTEESTHATDPEGSKNMESDDAVSKKGMGIEGSRGAVKEDEDDNTNAENKKQTNSESTENAAHAFDPEDSKNMESDETGSKTHMEVEGSREDVKEDEHADEAAQKTNYIHTDLRPVGDVTHPGEQKETVTDSSDEDMTTHASSSDQENESNNMPQVTLSDVTIESEVFDTENVDNTFDKSPIENESSHSDPVLDSHVHVATPKVDQEERKKTPDADKETASDEQSVRSRRDIEALEQLLHAKESEQVSRIQNLELMIVKLENKILSQSLDKQEDSTAFAQLENHILKLENELLKLNQSYQKLSDSHEALKSNSRGKYSFKELEYVQSMSPLRPKYPAIADNGSKELITQQKAKLGELSRQLMNQSELVQKLMSRSTDLEAQNQKLFQFMMNQTALISQIMTQMQVLNEENLHAKLQAEGFKSQITLLKESQENIKHYHAASATFGHDIPDPSSGNYQSFPKCGGKPSSTLSAFRKILSSGLPTAKPPPPTHFHKLSCKTEDRAILCLWGSIIVLNCVPFHSVWWSPCVKVKDSHFLDVENSIYLKVMDTKQTREARGEGTLRMGTASQKDGFSCYSKSDTNKEKNRSGDVPIGVADCAEIIQATNKAADGHKKLGCKEEAGGCSPGTEDKPPSVASPLGVDEKMERPSHKTNLDDQTKPPPEQNKEDAKTMKERKKAAAEAKAIHEAITRKILYESKDDHTAKDCYDLYKKGQTRNGMGRIFVIGLGMYVSVYCNMEAGGWTVLLRREDGQEDFYRDYQQYKDGFGGTRGEHYLGNEVVHYITNQKRYSLGVSLEDWEGNHKTATYDHFWLDGEDDAFKLHIYGYSGDAGDGLNKHSGMKFSTYDADNDALKTEMGGSCAKRFHGAGWYYKCYSSNLMGRYYQGGKIPEKLYDGITWKPWLGPNYSMKTAVLAIRPHGAQ
ncbi:uncharacterized protein LOC101849539 [Aplysia californica]|uniref:Uncharacterized protein LOC101849539 n=1 Tax=Aplysia californica TaxID=6500 RepID=A0ABM0JRC2_APLCA|nr:uncharacterized protein LOC101849539 [Aplysia californica]